MLETTSRCIRIIRKPILLRFSRMAWFVTLADVFGDRLIEDLLIAVTLSPGDRGKLCSPGLVKRLERIHRHYHL